MPPGLIDAHIGARLRERRRLLGLTQSQLGKSLGLTFQQIQKYENGSNRIPPARLYQLCKALEVDANYFFAGLDKSTQAARRLSCERQTIVLLRIWGRIEDARLRKACLEMLRAVAGSAGRSVNSSRRGNV